MIGTKEHYDILLSFEKNYKHKRLDREKNKELWKKCQIYENGEVNELYKAFILGYSLGKIYQWGEKVKYCKVYFKDEQHNYITDINGTADDIYNYFVGSRLQFGDTDEKPYDDLQTVERVVVCEVQPWNN